MWTECIWSPAVSFAVIKNQEDAFCVETKSMQQVCIPYTRPTPTSISAPCEQGFEVFSLLTSKQASHSFMSNFVCSIEMLQCKCIRGKTGLLFPKPNAFINDHGLLNNQCSGCTNALVSWESVGVLKWERSLKGNCDVMSKAGATNTFGELRSSNSKWKSAAFVEILMEKNKSKQQQQQQDNEAYRWRYLHIFCF